MSDPLQVLTSNKAIEMLVERKRDALELNLQFELEDYESDLKLLNSAGLSLECKDCLGVDVEIVEAT